MCAPRTKSTEPSSPQARGRPPTFDRKDALRIALDLFRRHGYEGVSIADLTTAIGIAAPSLYHAFGSKADLYREALRLYGSGGMSSEDVARAPSSHEAVRTMFERGIAAVCSPGEPRGCMVSSGMLMASAESEDLAGELRDIRAAARDALERRIAQDVEDGVLPGTTDAAALARFFSAVLQGMSVQALDGASTAELSSIAALALQAWPAGPRR